MLSFLFPQGLDTGKFLFQKASSETPMCLLFYVSLEGCVVCAQTPFLYLGSDVMLEKVC